MWERLSRRLAWDTHFWLSKACSASWDQHPAGRGAGAPRGEEGPPGPEQAPRWWGLHPGGQQGALHTGEQGEDAGSLQDVTPRPAPPRPCAIQSSPARGTAAAGGRAEPGPTQGGAGSPACGALGHKHGPGWRRGVVGALASIPWLRLDPGLPG